MTPTKVVQMQAFDLAVEAYLDWTRAQTPEDDERLTASVEAFAKASGSTWAEAESAVLAYVATCVQSYAAALLLYQEAPATGGFESTMRAFLADRAAEREAAMGEA